MLVHIIYRSNVNHDMTYKVALRFSQSVFVYHWSEVHIPLSQAVHIIVLIIIVISQVLNNYLKTLIMCAYDWGGNWQNLKNKLKFCILFVTGKVNPLALCLCPFSWHFQSVKVFSQCILRSHHAQFITSTSYSSPKLTISKVLTHITASIPELSNYHRWLTTPITTSQKGTTPSQKYQF